MTDPGWSDPSYEAVARLVGTRAGLSFPSTLRGRAEAGIARAMRRVGVTDPDRYRELLETRTAVLDDLLVELAVGETYFFREPAQFAFIRREILPDIRRRLGDAHGVRVWSAGCASGEEAYSLAIVLVEEGLRDRVRIRGTDVSRAALAKARAATYGPWSLRGEGATAARPYLRPIGDGYVVVDDVRRLAGFEYLNLAHDVYPSWATGLWAEDLVLCRNVLIYFDPDTIGRVARRLFETLAPGGWLLTSASDPPLAGHAPYDTILTDGGLLYRRPRHRPGRPGSRTPAPTRTEPDPGRRPPDRSADGTRGASPGSTPTNREDDVGAPADDPGACAERVQALATLDVAAAERACAAAVERHPFAAELHYLASLLLLDLGRHQDAADAARRVLYLDRSLAVAHFLLGTILRRRGDVDGARRAYRNARDLAAAQPPDEALALGEGERARTLAEAADAELSLLEPDGGRA